MSKCKTKYITFALEQAIKAQRRVNMWLHSLFNFGSRWEWVVNTTSRPLYSREKRPDTHGTGGWMGLRVGMDGYEKYPPTGFFDPRTVLCMASRSIDYHISDLFQIIIFCLKWNAKLESITRLKSHELTLSKLKPTPLPPRIIISSSEVIFWCSYKVRTLQIRWGEHEKTQIAFMKFLTRRVITVDVSIGSREYCKRQVYWRFWEMKRRNTNKLNVVLNGIHFRVLITIVYNNIKIHKYFNTQFYF
jgi:hypothetical protein